MASVRGILNIQSLIELSSENWIVHARIHSSVLRPHASGLAVALRYMVTVDASLAAWDFATSDCHDCKTE